MRPPIEAAPPDSRPRSRTVLPWILLCALVLLAAVPDQAHAQARPGRITARLSAPSRGLTGEIEVEADRLEQTRDGGTLLEGAVVLRWGESRMQADRITFREKRFVEADGNVLVVWTTNRIAGTRMSYDLQEDRGVIEDAVGQVDPEFYFSAERAEMIGRERVDLTSATVTTCTQPIPYWSFSVSSARVNIDHYAHLYNLRLKVGRVPVFYSPYLVWPVKRERAAGLLFPEFGTTRDRGRVITQGLFLPLGRSADVTLFGEYYTVAGFGGGGEMHVVPNAKGLAVLSGFYIQDEVAGFARYRVTYRQTQEFLNGFRMIADINQVSDFDFFTDFERELRLASSPTILARIEFTRNGQWTSVNVRDLRRDQLFANGTTLVQSTLPEIEWRGRSHRMGRTPLYFSFESSAAWIQQYGEKANADYYRGDFFPVVTMPLSPVPWLDITPAVTYRATYYTQRRLMDGSSDTKIGVDDAIVRAVGGAGIEVVGPKFSKIFQKSDGPEASKLKHTFEPRLAYAFQQGAKRFDELLVYDDVDRNITAQNLFTYGMRTRLFARRPRAAQPLAAAGTEAIVLPDGTTSEAPAAEHGTSAPLAVDAAVARKEEPVEILSFDLRQSRSIDGILSRADSDGDFVIDMESPYSPVELSGRYRARDGIDFDMRTAYSVLFDRISDLSVAGTIYSELARANFSLVHRPGLGDSAGAPIPDQTQVRLALGVTLFGGKWRIDTDGSYVVNPQPGQTRVPDRRWRMEYYTQCCGFLGEYLSRDFSSSNSRKEFRFTVDLRGIGKLFDLHAGEDR